MRKLLLKYIWLSICLAALLKPGNAMAGIEPYNGYLSGASVVTSAVMQVHDPLWTATAHPGYVNYKITDILKLSFEKDLRTIDTIPFKVSVAFKVWHVSIADSTHYDTVTLTINYDPHKNTNYTDLAAFRFKGWLKFKAEIVSITSSLGYTPPNLLIEGDVTTERYYTFDCDSLPETHFIRDSFNGITNELEIKWKKFPGAEEYDLEWTFVSDENLNSLDTLTLIAATNLPFNFKHNASRITTTETSYPISLVYRRGYILYRIRPVGRKAPFLDQRIEGIWSTSSTPGNVVSSWDHTYHIITPHEPRLNWTYKADFAEDAKKKEVLKYFDGSQYLRQTVTRSNTQYVAIVQEDFYDCHGRQAIKVLPAPAFTGNTANYSAKLNYYPNFNRNASRLAYDSADFGGSLCDNTTANAMDTSNGASKYYSSNNPLSTFQENAFIPDAMGYPFVQTEYLADNTNRIRRQGGVGIDHRLGTNHETQFMYSTPDPIELYRLFGSDIGKATSYKKFISIDANGQTHVTYKDIAGKVVATALAGNVPDSLVSADTSSTWLTENLMTKNEYLPDSGMYRMTDAFSVTKPTTYFINYSLNAATYHACIVDSFCYNCVYDFNLRVMDHCGKAIMNFSRKMGTFHPYNSHCAIHPDSVYKDTSILLNIGDYTLVKTVSVNQTSLDSYTTAYMDTSKCILTEDYFINQAIKEIDSSDCHKNTHYVQGTASPCDGPYQLMLMDVSPGGQYAQLPGVGCNHLSVLDSNSLLPNSAIKANWRHPWDGHYYDRDGNIDSVQIYGKKYAPYQLSLDTFVIFFKQSWAKSLVHYHPEYGYYSFCIENINSYARDDSMRSVNTYAEAKKRNYINNPLTLDPLFDTIGKYKVPNFSTDNDLRNVIYGIKVSMANDMLAYKTLHDTNNHYIYRYSMWSEAAIATACDHSGDTGNYSCFYSIHGNNAAIISSIDADSCDQDAYWCLFRGMYLGLKQKYLEQAQTYYAIFHRNYNACIGNPAYILSSSYDSFLCFRYPVFAYTHWISGCTSPYDISGDSWQPEYHSNMSCYTTKTPRFKSMSSYIGYDVFNVDTAVVHTAVKDSMKNMRNQCANFCKGNIPAWYARLQGCNMLTDTADSAFVIRHMLTICKAGCDSAHPIGASTLKPGVASLMSGGCAMRSFEDVMRCRFPAYKPTTTCDVNLITSPPPYDNIRQGISIAGAVLDICGCDKVLKANYIFEHKKDSLAAKGITDQSQLMFVMDNVYYSPFRKLVCACNNAWTNNGLTWSPDAVWTNEVIHSLNVDSVIVPKQLTCNPSMASPGGCIDCSMMQDSLNAFNKKNPHAFGSANYQDLLQNYLNKAFQLDLSFEDYVGFIQNCSLCSQDTVSTCTARTAQAAALELFIRNIFDTTRTHTYKDTFYLTTGADAAIFDTILYFHKRTSCGLKYTPIKTYKGQLYAQLSDSCGFSCFISVKLPYDSQRIGSLRFSVEPDLEADTPNTSGTHYNFVMQGLYNGSAVTVHGYSSCYPIMYCDRASQSTSICSPRIVHRKDPPTAKELILVNNDTCACNAVAKIYNITKLNPALWDTTPAVLGLAFDSVFLHQYGFYTTAVDNTLQQCKNAILNAMYVRGQHIDSTTRYLKTHWSDTFTNEIRGTAYTMLTCPTCNTCQEYEHAITDFDQTSAGAQTGAHYYASLQSYLGSRKGYAVKVSAAPSGSACAATNLLVCDSINQTAKDLQNLLDTLAQAHRLRSARVRLDSFSYFKTTSLNLRTDADSIVDSAHSTANGILYTFKYWKSHAIAGTCTIHLSGLSYSTLAGADSIKNIVLDPRNKGSNSHFLVAVYYHSGASHFVATDSGYSSCYSFGNCCLIDKRRMCAKDPAPPAVDTSDCYKKLMVIAISKGKSEYYKYITDVRGNFKKGYAYNCLHKAKEFMTLRYRYNTFHFTLYYYDVAGNLVKTVPPAGVHPMTNTVDLNKLADPNLLGFSAYPAHTLFTIYKYNTLNKIIAQTSPDRGLTQTWYDRLGRPALTQNAVQAPLHKFAYIRYDALSRVIETGELMNTHTGVVTPDSFRIDAKLQAFINTGQRTQIINTYYDSLINSTVNAAFGAKGQQNLRSRMASMTYRDKDTVTYNYATHFSYDEHGNVQSLIREFPELKYCGFDFFKIDYYYDLISGKINEVAYQQGRPDQFYHLYDYDADNRLVNVSTSRDSLIWNKEADYTFYTHGGLARLVLGQDNVQGLDYAYNINGWLKGVNSGTLVPGRDMGQDGWQPGTRANIARDAFGFTMGYFTGDYKSIGSSAFEASISGSELSAASSGLYDGNIRHIVTASAEYGIQATAYTYDQLYRLLYADVNTGIDIANNKWLNGGNTPYYHEAFAYDANSNTIALIRRGDTLQGLEMDSMIFNYNSGTNQLNYIHDLASPTAYDNDIDDQSPNNFTYNAIGDMISDRGSEIMSLDYNVYHKLISLVRTGGSLQPNLSYRYGADQQLMRELVKGNDSVGTWKYKYYVRDAQGNIMATYERSLKDVHELSAGACERILPTFDSVVSWSNYVNFFSNDFSGETWFVDDLLDSMTTTFTVAESTIVNSYPPSYYASHDAGVYSDVLNHYPAGSTLTYLINCGDGNPALNYLLGIYNLSIYTQALTANCTTFLNALLAVNPAAIGYAYSVYFPGPPPSFPVMIDSLCSSHSPPSPMSLAWQLFSFNAASMQTAFESMSSADIMTTLNVVFGGTIPISPSQFMSMYSAYDLVHCAETQDVNLNIWLHFHYTDNDLLSRMKTFDPSNFVQLSLTFAAPDINLAQNIVCSSSYPMSSFLEKIRLDGTLGSPIVTEIWVRMTGIPGGLVEKFNIKELDMYGAKRLGVLNVDTTLVKRNYDGHPEGDEIVIDSLFGPVHNLVYDTSRFTRVLGRKSFEITNHLENVLAIVSDRKVAVDSNHDGTIDYFDADVRGTFDYYAYGSQKPHPHWALATTPAYIGLKFKLLAPLNPGESIVLIVGGTSYTLTSFNPIFSTVYDYLNDIFLFTGISGVSFVPNFTDSTSTMIVDTSITHWNCSSSVNIIPFGAAITMIDMYGCHTSSSLVYQPKPIDKYVYGHDGQRRDDEARGKARTFNAMYWNRDGENPQRTNYDFKTGADMSGYSTFGCNPIWKTDFLGDKPTPQEAAAIERHVKGDQKDNTLIGDWKVSPRDFGIRKEDPKTGLKSNVYERTVNGITEYVYAIAGTKSWTDVGQDIIQPAGIAKQYKLAMKNAGDLDRQLKVSGQELTFVGHSLGGGEAAAGAMITGRSAITFNAAGVSLLTLKDYKLQAANIDAYILMTDPLNNAQNANDPLGQMMPDVNGTRHYLMPVDFQSIYNGHVMENVEKAINMIPGPPDPNETIHNMGDLHMQINRWMNWKF